MSGVLSINPNVLASIISGYTGLKGRHDPFLIQHRTRLFQSFLMNLRGSPYLRGDHFFHRLIDSSLIGSAWSEGITMVPARLEPHGTSTAGSEVSLKGKVPDPLVVRLEEMTEKYREGLKAIEKGQSKLLKRLKGICIVIPLDIFTLLLRRIKCFE